ncbi:MAG: hypothetical protein E6I08_07750 [Chloroflexi bacterium]|nr:MAG: hypothetical protein E6I08_07750 [Chloroflexota bacterium]
MPRSQAVMTLLAVLFLGVFGTWLYRESTPAANVASAARVGSAPRVASGTRATPAPKPTPPPPPAPIALAFTQQDPSAPLHLLVMLAYDPGDVHAVEIGWNRGTLGDWHYNVISGEARLASFDDHHMVWGAAGAWLDLLVPPATGKKAGDIGFQAWDDAAPNTKYTPSNPTAPEVLVGVTSIQGPATARAGSTVTYHLFTTAPQGVHLSWSGFGGADLKPTGPGSNPLTVSATGDVSFKVQAGTGLVSLYAWISGTNVCCQSNTKVLSVTK